MESARYDALELEAGFQHPWLRPGLELRCHRSQRQFSDRLEKIALTERLRTGHVLA